MDARGVLRSAFVVLVARVDRGRVDYIFNRRARAHTSDGAPLAFEVCLVVHVLTDDGPANLSWVPHPATACVGAL
jgi:hypothetical protein